MAIFGNDNGDLLRQIIGQLGQLGADLAAVKQQVGDQQHAIDRIRQDATAAINTGLTENRAVIRDGLARANETVSGPLANIGNELVAIRGGIGQIDSQLKTTAAAAQPVPQEREPVAAPTAIEDQAPEAEPATETSETRDDEEILRAAAGIAHATIEAHRDTWAFLIQTAGREQHFHIPGKVEDDGGFVRARVSGPSIVAAITSLNEVADTAGHPVTQAIAAHIHQKITAAVQAVIDNPHSGEPGNAVRIVIDDRAAVADDGPPEND